MRQKVIRLDSTKSGLPAIWEAGGGYSNSGHATIVAGRDGEPLRPIYIRRRGHLAGAEHVLFVAKPGLHVVEARHHRRDFWVAVWRIEGIRRTEDGGHEADLGLVAEYDMGEWAPALPSFLQAAVDAAMSKATCYHCREPHFTKEVE